MAGFMSRMVKAPRKLLTPVKGQGDWVLRVFWMWLITGGVYYIIEGIWRIRSNGGWANIAMMPIGGLCGVLVAIMNENPKFTRKKMAVRALYGMAALVVVEFVSGYVMNILLGMHIWDYSSIPMNVMGQVCLPFAALWFLFVPFIIWFDDFIRRELWDEGVKYPWYRNYIRLVTWK